MSYCLCQSEVEEEEEESEEDDEPAYMPKRGAYLQSKKQAKKQPPKPKLPPISEMVIESIKALKDHPKKGSSLRSIKVPLAQVVAYLRLE